MAQAFGGGLKHALKKAARVSLKPSLTMKVVLANLIGPNAGDSGEVFRESLEKEIGCPVEIIEKQDPTETYTFIVDHVVDLVALWGEYNDENYRLIQEIKKLDKAIPVAILSSELLLWDDVKVEAKLSTPLRHPDIKRLVNLLRKES